MRDCPVTMTVANGEPEMVWLSRVPCVGERIYVNDQLFVVETVTHRPEWPNAAALDVKRVS